MIPALDEIIEMIERDLPGWSWLLRNITSNERDTLRGDKGKYFAHVSLGDNHDPSCKVIDEYANGALFTAYQLAMDRQNGQSH